MADLILSNCSTEGDLGQIAQSLLDEAARIRDQLLAQVALLNSSDVQADLDAINKQYDQVIAPASNSEVAGQIGLPSQNPDEGEDEARLEPLGLVLIKGIVYARGTDQNIENFRKLFFAVGSDVTRFLSLVKSEENLIVVQTRLMIRRMPLSKNSWTLAEARSLFQNDAIEQIYTASDGGSYVVVPQFLAVNKSVEQAALEVGISPNEVVTQVFWLREVQQNSARINQLIALGLGEDERTSILTDQPVKVVRPTTIETLRVELDRKVRKALDQMELVNSRFSQLDPGSKENFRKEIQLSILEGREVIQTLQKKIRFAPVLIENPDDIDTFLSFNKREDLPYMFSVRRTVSSINFAIPKPELMTLIRNATQIPAGSNTVSSILSNSPSQLLDPDVSSTNQSWVYNECAMMGLSKRGDLRWLDLSAAHGCLASTSSRPPATVVSNVPVIGYETFDSPSSILFRRADLSLTLQIPNLFDMVLDLAKLVAKPIEEAIKVLIAMLKSLRQAVEAVLKPLINKVQEIVGKIESFLSRHASYFGTASLDSSILKCALNLDLQASLPFLDGIAPFLEVLQRKMKNIIAMIAEIVGEFLSKLTCLPMNFMSDLLKGVTSYLPAFCKTDTFKLPPNLEAALMELREGFLLENTTFANFSRNLLNLQAAINSVPAKIDSFKESVACNQTPLNSRFMSTFRKDISLDIGTNPLGQVAKLIPPRG